MCSPADGPVDNQANASAGLGNLSPELRELVKETFLADANRRATAAQMIGQLGRRGTPAIPFLIRLLNDTRTTTKRLPLFEGRDPLVGSCASTALRKIGAPAMEACLAALPNSAGSEKVGLIYALGEFTDKRAQKAILSFLPDPDKRCRFAAVIAVGQHADRLRIAPLSGP
jgi:HEAT repeat protein